MEKEKQIAVNSTATSEAKTSLYTWLKRSNKLLSAIMDEQISNADTLRMCNVTTSFLTMVFSANYSPITPIIGMAWLITAIVDCKTNLKQ